jgi:hypothetical protein
MALATLKRQLEAIKASQPPPAGKYESFLVLLAREASDPANSQARREPEIYCTLTHAEKIDVHRREIERLKAQAPGIDAAQWAQFRQFIANEQGLIEELEAQAQAAAREDEEKVQALRADAARIDSAHAEPDRLRGYKERQGDEVREPKYT